MTTEIVLIGLDVVGASIGLALGEAELDASRTGYDPDGASARAARTLGAVDRLAFRPEKAARNADLVILNTSPELVRDQIQALGGVLKPGAVVLDITPLKTLTSAWASTVLPEERHYIGGALVINPLHLYDSHLEWKTPRADLFRGGLFALMIPPKTSEKAMDTVLAVAKVIGAAPFFIEPSEVDAVAAVTDSLPALAGAALMRVAVEAAGWREIRRMAGRHFATATSAGASPDAAGLASMLRHNRFNVLAKLDDLLAELQAYRTLIASEDEEALAERLTSASEAYHTWREDRHRSEWAREEQVGDLDIPKISTAERLLGIRPLDRKGRK
ncbi:MAG TPA: prephenate dehydrogenase/arogenate dehydrogenase family protein [Anaerolineales bacterium]|nr:prephenate dehydrogenase/arogenate dehydrogenase family protein [Anaerolineales bacterium]